MRFAVMALAAALLATPVSAEQFNKIDERDDFVTLIRDQKLTRFGIRLTVTPSGKIVGRAFGRDVSGAWEWRAGYFCRDLYWGQRDLGANCQEVKVQGERMRFTSDRGTGQFADLYLR
ncbi:MAG: dihydrodipicolinate reductase [Pseudomonadota bacterium]